MSKSGKLTPKLDEKTTKLINLTVLQRSDPAVEEILMTAAHVAMYELNTDATEWSRKDVEGSLFVVKRNGQPRFQFIVMNRLSTDNMVENLLADFEYEVQSPYLLYRIASQEVYGIWFYNPEECVEIGNLFGRILNTYPKVSAKPKESPVTSNTEDLAGVSTQPGMDDPATSNPPEVPSDQSFMKFFSNAMNIGSTQNTAISGQPYHSPPTGVPTYPHLVAPTTLPPAHIPPSLSSSTPILPILEKADSKLNTIMKHPTDLVTPSSFFSPPNSTSTLIIPPMTSSIPTTLPLNPQGNLPPPYSTSLLRPFPPPTPAQPLTPTPAPAPSYAPVVSRERIREALHMLVEDSKFIDMVYQAVVNAHRS